MTFVENKNAQIITSASFHFALVNSSREENELYYRIGQQILKKKKTASNNFDSLILFMAEAFPNFVLIDTKSFVFRYEINYGFSMLHGGREHLNENSVGIALPKKSPLLEPFDKQLKTI